MTTKEIYLTGTVKWCKYLEPDRYGNYSVNLYLDDKSKEKFKESGSRTTPKEDDDGEFVVLRRKEVRRNKDGDEIDNGRPVIFDADNNVIEDERLIGNGSKVTCKIRVYPTSMGPGTSWESLRIEELVEYDAVEKDMDIDEPF